MVQVSLPMYNLPEMRPANTGFWQALRAELARLGVHGLPEVPDFDGPPVPYAIGTDVLFTQACGWPLQTIYAGQAVMLGVPVYDAAYCVGANHAGVFVVHRDAAARDLAGLRNCHFVFNSVHSNSGYNLPRRAIAELAGGGGFFASVRQTHSHPGNLERVARGEADATCVDCVTYAFFVRHRPQMAAELRIIAATPPSPALPFVTSVATPPALRAALAEALMRVARDAAWADARDGLMLRDIVPAEPARYAVLRSYTAEATSLGYPELR